METDTDYAADLGWDDPDLEDRTSTYPYVDNSTQATRSATYGAPLTGEESDKDLDAWIARGRAVDQPSSQDVRTTKKTTGAGAAVGSLVSSGLAILLGNTVIDSTVGYLATLFLLAAAGGILGYYIESAAQ